MTERAIDLRWGTRALRRAWRQVAVAGVAGAVLAALYTAVLPPSLDSTSLVLLSAPTSATQSAASLAATQVAIARSTEVLQRAGRSMTPRLSARQMGDRVQVSASTDELIRIDGLGSTRTAAQAASRAASEAYVAVVQEAERSVTAASLSDLVTRESDLQHQLTSLQTELQTTTAREQGESATSADGVRDAQLEAQLRAEQADISLQLDKVKDDIATNENYGSTTDAGISLVEPATPATRTGLLGRLTLWMPAGLLVGLLVGACVILFRDRRDRRLWLRDEIADALGSPVLATVTARPRTSAAQWTELLGTYRPSDADAWALRQTLRALAVGGEGPRRPVGVGGQARGPASVLVACYVGDDRGLALGVQLASYAASRGTATRLVIGGEDDAALSLRAACAVGGAERRPGLVVARASSAPAGDGPQADEATDDGANDGANGATIGAAGADLEVVLWVVDRRRPVVAQAPGTRNVILAVSPGTAQPEDLARLAVAVDDRHGAIDGILLADGDPSDGTSGRRLPGERGREISLPFRVLGGRPGANILPERSTR